MKISEGIEEEGIVVGNAYDKYASTNPIVRALMKGFESSLADMIAKVAPKTVHEVGCGEGYHSLRWKKQGLQVLGSDFSPKVIEIAQSNAAEQGEPQEMFKVRSIYDLQRSADSADLIICCEVLEHLEYPDMALEVLQRVASSSVILSVPREPLWRILNISRGKYIANFGNTPGHIQHWSKLGIIGLVARYFEIEEVRSPLPWTMLRCSVRY
jgi:2-polyprenyl-3-methyl-5-hydroxy-6-metoxy-1,4-benzoquinol methylase